MMLCAGLGVVVTDVIRPGVADLFGPSWEQRHVATRQRRSHQRRRSMVRATELVDITAGPDGLAGRLRASWR